VKREICTGWFAESQGFSVKIKISFDLTQTQQQYVAALALIRLGGRSGRDATFGQSQTMSGHKGWTAAIL
jgi:late competence protein required for DNA uptake (superfamily II DNA/RNA helicase)